MATSTPTRHAWRALIGLVILIAVLAGINTLGVLTSGKASWAPGLGLDLQGGTQIVLQAKTPNGQSPTSDQLNQAVSIIRQRVDASGVGESDIGTQSGNQIVVQIPGQADEATRQRIEASAQMQLRPVLYVGSPATSFVGKDGKSTPYPTPAPTLQSTPSPAPTNASDTSWITPALQAEFLHYDCTAKSNNPADAPKDKPLITCDTEHQQKYILGPVELDGTDISTASSGQDPQNGQWVVQLKFNANGTAKFTKVSTRLFGLQSPLNQFAFVLDGEVISAPQMQAVITDGSPQISGNFTQQSSQILAEQLKYGALPLSFNVVSSTTISATLGSQQLQIGLITGLIGLALVALYSLISYRALGFVIIASLAVMGIITYLMLCILSWRIGFRLSLAGVAGLIVTIGFTADSFIVYFERIRDELREGDTITAAVEDGWSLAKRTIYIAKAVNILAAVVLYILADATVKGFAFTLGLTTAIDILIFIVFTHPVMQLVARTRFFGEGHRLSGMDPETLNASYRAPAQFRPAVVEGSGGAARKSHRSHGEAEKRQTIAERKLAAQQAATPPNSPPPGGDEAQKPKEKATKGADR